MSDSFQYRDDRDRGHDRPQDKRQLSRGLENFFSIFETSEITRTPLPKRTELKSFIFSNAPVFINQQEYICRRDIYHSRVIFN